MSPDTEELLHDLKDSLEKTYFVSKSLTEQLTEVQFPVDDIDVSVVTDLVCDLSKSALDKVNKVIEELFDNR